MAGEETQWSRADRAASALTTYSMETRGGEGYGDEGSAEFHEVLVDFMTDLKHLLVRFDGPMLEDLAQDAVARWSSEVDDLPVGSDDDEP